MDRTQRPRAKRTFRGLRRAAAVACALFVASGLLGTGTAAGASPVEVPVASDTFVNPYYPDSSFGAKAVLKVDDTPKMSLLTFQVPGGSAREYLRVVLRMRATEWSAPGRVSVHQAYGRVDEQATTFRSAPRIGPAIATVPVEPDRWLAVELTVLPDDDGRVALALSRTETGRDIVFHSRESSAAPRLLVGRGVEPVDGPFLAYTPDSFFRTPLPDDAPLDPESARGISLTKANDTNPYPIIRGVDGNDWGMPYALATCADPLWKVSGPVPSEVDFLRTQGFHAPSGFADTLTGTSDSPFVLIDRCGVPAMPQGFTVWGFRASPAGPGTISVESAGAFAHDSNGLDQRNPRSDSDVNFRGRGAIPDAMLIRDDLLAAAVARDGDLGHVLHMFWWETDSSAGAVHPMVGAESGKAGFGAEGMRIRIRPEIDLRTRGCSPAGLAVARTLQRYGSYLGDNAGGEASGIKAEQGSHAITRDALSCVRWDDFVFVQRGWDGSTG